MVDVKTEPLVEIRDSYVPVGKVQRLLGLPLSYYERRLFLMILDLLAINGSFLMALALRPEHRLKWQLIIQYPVWFLVLSALWLLLAHAFDVYDLGVSGRFSTAALSVLKAGFFNNLVYFLIPYITPSLPTSRSSLFASFLFTFIFLLIGRGFYLLALTQPFFQRRALIIGAGQASRTIAEVLNENGDDTYKIVGFVDNDLSKQGLKLNVSKLAFYVCNWASVPELIINQKVTTLILDITYEINNEMLQILADCIEMGVEIIPMPVLYEQMTGRVPIEYAVNHWYVVMPNNHPGTRPLNQLLKRISDVILASLGFVCLAPMFPFIALAIYLESPGPIFYNQWRVGKGGRLFKAFKFRSMVSDAEKGKAIWAQKNDQRVTRVGKFLRRTHVDEFPQFINILKGEMSAVGPRPERPEFVEELAREIPLYRVRHAVRPGMAGWGLVKQGYSASKGDALIKLQYDLYYIKHQSLWFDILILIRTIMDTIKLRGRA